MKRKFRDMLERSMGRDSLDHNFGRREIDGGSNSAQQNSRSGE